MKDHCLRPMMNMLLFHNNGTLKYVMNATFLMKENAAQLEWLRPAVMRLPHCPKYLKL